ncbi:MAG: hypothetical protein ABI743_12505, partial [bacterium]
TPDTISTWRDIPAVPVEAHKDQLLFAWRPDEAVRVFRTSGTTQGMRGSNFLHTLRLYDAALWQSFQAMMLPDGARDFLCAFLVQPPPNAPDSSLSHMLGTVIDVLDPSQRPFVMSTEGINVGRVESLCTSAVDNGLPLLLCATAFALARFFELSKLSFALPAGSRVMETGGFKGHVSTYDRGSLYDAIPARLGIPLTHIVSEYGMTELSSQCYSGALRAAMCGDVEAEGLTPAPWLRVRVVDPETGLEMPRGAPGLIQFLDLANLDTVACVYTSDMGRMVGENQLELMGRLPGADRRGCSLQAAEILGEVEPEEY